MANTPNFGWLKLDPSVRAIRNWLNGTLDSIDSTLHEITGDVGDFVKSSGKSGGQSIAGGTASGEHLDLDSTAHATKGEIRANSVVRFVRGIVKFTLQTAPSAVAGAWAYDGRHKIAEDDATWRYVVQALNNSVDNTGTPRAISGIRNIRIHGVDLPVAVLNTGQSLADQLALAATYAPISHGHIIGDVASLQDALDGKSPTTHTHELQRCRAFHSEHQSLANNTETMLALDSESYDNASMHDGATNNSRITFPAAGVYIYGGCARFDTNSTGTRGLNVRKNGTTYVASDIRPGLSGVPTDCTLLGMGSFAVNDYIEMGATQNSGGALDVRAENDFSPTFWAQRVF